MRRHVVGHDGRRALVAGPAAVIARHAGDEQDGKVLRGLGEAERLQHRLLQRAVGERRRAWRVVLLAVC